MKKILIGFSCILIIVIFVITYNASFSASYRQANVKNIELSTLSNDNHSNELMELAQESLISEFKEDFDGCKLLKISYYADDDKYLDKKYNNDIYDEVIVLNINFSTDDKQEVYDLNKTYENYKIVLARKTSSTKFRIIDKYE